jgi:uncharacterized metal-binding protein
MKKITIFWGQWNSRMMPVTLNGKDVPHFASRTGTMEQRLMTRNRSFTLLTCSGVSNTGRLTTQAASILVHRDPDLFDCHLSAKQVTTDLLRELEFADRLVIIDGCGDRCAAKKLKESGIEPDIHIIVTDNGIAKKGMAEVEYWEIERLIQGILRELQGVGPEAEETDSICDRTGVGCDQ